MESLHLEYLEEYCDAEGRISDFRLRLPERFNFAVDCVDRIAAAEPGRRAMLWCGLDESRRTFTFGEMSRLGRQAAAYFRSIGIRRGDRVLLILKRHHQFWSAMLGLAHIGAVAVPATCQLKAMDLAYRIECADIQAVIATMEGETAAEIEQAEEDLDYSIPIRLAVHGSRPGWADYDAGLAGAPPWTAPLPAEQPVLHDEMVIYFTSGTTGLAKMVSLDYAYPLAHIVTAKYWQNVNPNGLHLTVSESGWAKTLWGKLYGQWLLGAGIYVYDFDRFDPADLLEHIAADGITTFCAAPTIYRFLIHEDLTKYDLSALEHSTVAGEAVNPEVFNAWKRATGLEMREGFGQTETTPTVATFYWMKAKAGSMGCPNPIYDVVLLDEDGVEQGPGGSGEICLRPPGPPGDPANVGMFSGYAEDPELTAAYWYDGYYHTNDLASMDEDGYLWYEGRSDDMIKSSGYKISPFEVENVVMTHPAVLECAVTGVPDEIRGEVVRASIRLAPGYSPSDTLAHEIQNHVKSVSAPYKYPRVVDFVDELPKTVSGKVRRVVLRQQAAVNA